MDLGRRDFGDVHSRNGGRPWIGKYSDSKGRAGPYLISLAAMASLVILASILPNVILMVAALLVYVAGSAFAWTTSVTWLTDLATFARLNQGYSSAASAIGWAGGLIIGAISGGTLLSIVGYLSGALIIAEFLLIIAVIASRSAMNQTPTRDLAEL